MKKSIRRTLIGLGIFLGIIIVVIIAIFITIFIRTGISAIREKSVSETGYIGETTGEEQEIIGYRDTELRDKVPVVRWEIGKPIDYPDGLRLVLNRVWVEEQENYPFVIINITLINKTDEVRDGIDFCRGASYIYVWDSENNKFLGSGGFNIEDSIWGKIDSLSPGVNKKWPPWKEITGNIYFDVSGNTGGLVVELEYSEFIGPNIIYRYILKDTEAKAIEEIVIPTELEARERIEEGVGSLINLSNDLQALHEVANWLPENWQTGILVVKDDNPIRWGKNSQMYYYLVVKSQGGILYVTWGAQNFYYYKSWTEIEEAIVKNYPPGTTDWAGGSFIAEIVWKDDPLWKEEYIWRDDTFWEDEFWDLIYDFSSEN
jgi:hypothetical protein